MTLNLLAMGRDIALAFSLLYFTFIRDIGVHKHGYYLGFLYHESVPFDVSKIHVLGSDYHVLALWLHMNMHVLVSARVPVQGRGSKKSRIYAVRCKRKCK